jgi:hypothetical protein
MNVSSQWGIDQVCVEPTSSNFKEDVRHLSFSYGSVSTGSGIPCGTLTSIITFFNVIN